MLSVKTTLHVLPGHPYHHPDVVLVLLDKNDYKVCTRARAPGDKFGLSDCEAPWS